MFDAADKGYGLRTIDRIDSRTFVCEYAGEIIDANEVLHRDRIRRQSTSTSHNYVLTVNEHFNGFLFSRIINNLDNYFSDRIQVTYIDPSKIGNLARFINHSCAPNLRLTIIRYGCRVPHVGLFALRDIEPMEELTYDYGSNDNRDVSSNDNEDATIKRCYCASSNCRQLLPYSATAIS